MSIEQENEFIVLTDEHGNEVELEHLDTVEYNENVYMAFVPADSDEQESYELIIMKLEKDESGEEMLVTLDDEQELDDMFQIFSERLEESFEEDGEDEQAELEKEGY